MTERLQEPDAAGDAHPPAAVGQVRSHVEPVRLRLWSEHLGSTVLRTVGHRYTCSCGERGRVESRYADANDARAAHLAERHPRPEARR